MEKNMNVFNCNLYNFLIISGMDVVELVQIFNVELLEINCWLNGFVVLDVYQFQEIVKWFGMFYFYFFESEQSLFNVLKVVVWLGLLEEMVEILLVMVDIELEDVMDVLDDVIYVMVIVVSVVGEVDME